MITRQYLIHSLHTISSYFNSSYNIIDSDCVETIYSIFDNYKKGSSEKLRKIIENDKTVSLSTEVDEDIICGLDPLSAKNRETTDSDILMLDDREDQIKYAIWKVLPTSPNPIYQELKQYCKELKTLHRLFYLQMVYRLDKSEENSYSDYTPLGFYENMQKVQTNQSKNDDILCIGNIWDIDKLNETISDDSTNSIRVEKYFFEHTINNLKLNSKLGWQQNSYLTIQLNTYSIKTSIEIDFIIKQSSILCKILYDIQKDYSEKINELEAFEWRRIVNIVLFTLSDEFDYYINTFLKIKDSGYYNLFKSSFDICAPLARRDIKTKYLRLKINKDNIEYLLEDDKREFLFKLNLKDKNFEDKINKLYEKHIKHIFLSQKHKNKTFLHKLRYDMQNLKFGKVRDRVKNITRKANQLVFAHKISYYAYIGNEDRLKPLVHKRDRQLRYDDMSIEKRVKKEAYIASEDTLKIWGSDDKLREQSKLYYTLDREKITSRFLNEDVSAILSHSIDVVGLEIEHEWFDNEKDVIILPVMFHGRKQGVLYLATAHENQFLYQDRLNITNFIQVFEAELFEARLTVFLKEINQKLRDVLKDKKENKNILFLKFKNLNWLSINNKLTLKDYQYQFNEFSENFNNKKQINFFNYISQQLSNLLGAVGTIIWWNHSDNNQEFELLGFSGKSIKTIINNKTIEYNELFKKRFNHKNSSTIEYTDINPIFQNKLKEIGYGHSINLKMVDEYDNLLGIVMILDKNKPKNISQAFEEEAKFLLEEIQGLIIHYFTVKGKIADIRLLLGHDVNSAFRTISGTQQRLKAYNKIIPIDEKKDYNKKLIDIEIAVETGKEMLDYITNEEIYNSSSSNTPIMDYLSYFNNTKDIKSRVNIKNIIDNILHGKDKDLKKIGIRFFFRPNDEFYDLQLWIHRIFLHDVLSNLIDNVAKYSKRSSSLYIDISKNYADYVIKVKNIGIILNEEAKDNPDLIFEKNERYLPENKEKEYSGKGIGLYTSRETCRFWGGNLIINYQQIEPIWANYEFEITFPLWLSLEDNPYKRR